VPVFMAAKSGYDLGGGFVPGRGGGRRCIILVASVCNFVTVFVR